MEITEDMVATVPSRLRLPKEPSPCCTLWKNTLMRAAGRVGVALHWALGSRSRNAFGILTYHRIASHVPNLPAPLHNVEPNRFREQLTGLLERGFQFWPLAKAMAYHESGTPIPPKTTVVTFDDGFATTFAKAYPILRELAIPASVFVTTAYLDSDDPFPFDAWGIAHRNCVPRELYRSLSIRECLDMHRSGVVQIGVHTHTHADYRGFPDEFGADVRMSIEVVQSRFGIGLPPFAFPFGSVHDGFASPSLVDEARRSGVTCALTTDPTLVQPGSDRFRWGRFNVFPWDSSATLAAKLAGWYGLTQKLYRGCAKFGNRMVYTGQDGSPLTTTISR